MVLDTVFLSNEKFDVSEGINGNETDLVCI